jgi:hypothetical protein
VVEHLWQWHPTTPMFGNMGAFTGGEHFFCREVLEHLQFHSQCQKKQVECRPNKSLVYVHYNLQLLSHYCEEAKEDKNLKHWDNYPEEDNLEDGVMLLEQLENALFDDDDHAERPPLATTRPNGCSINL